MVDTLLLNDLVDLVDRSQDFRDIFFPGIIQVTDEIVGMSVEGFQLILEFGSDGTCSDYEDAVLVPFLGQSAWIEDAGCQPPKDEKDEGYEYV